MYFTDFTRANAMLSIDPKLALSIDDWLRGTASLHAIFARDAEHPCDTELAETGFPTIEKVYANAPATVVLWSDGTKTVVKCQTGDAFSIETGIALCYMKKALGNTSRSLNDAMRTAVELVSKASEHEGKKVDKA